MKYILLLALAAALHAQPLSLHVTATPNSRAATKAAFGNLGNYLVASVDICATPPVSAKIATARVRQAVTMPAGYTLLSSQVAVTVIQDAQGRSPTATAARWLSASSSAAGAAVAIHAVPTSGWGSAVILGAQGLSILLADVLPAFSTHAVLGATTLLPEMLDFDLATGACISAPVLVSGPKRVTLGLLDQMVIVDAGMTLAPQK